MPCTKTPHLKVTYTIINAITQYDMKLTPPVAPVVQFVFVVVGRTLGAALASTSATELPLTLEFVGATPFVGEVSAGAISKKKQSGRFI